MSMVLPAKTALIEH